ncbi:prostatic acid phosphatase-like isoform X2 [Leptopilina heterotoma]|uniref:prostatic acid phosphatase-like isoform X2 n=1 Tax=Leptopilina heterotoma TaxID=63436 RepID=UPI001CA884C8|nr:prostatic acid phosphatase-like isoform X2 [Leptopilina heterotoma]
MTSLKKYVFIVILIISATILATGARIVRDISKEKDDNSLDTNTDSLRLVTLVLRHGDRTPQDTYPNDPYINDSFEPYGWGQLTNKGRLNQYNQGVYLRERYGKFLQSKYSPDIFWLQSTAPDRAKMSALLEAAGLWKPDEKQTFKTGFPWQPVALHYQTDNDTLLLIWSSCPDYPRLHSIISNSKEIKEIESKNSQLFQELSKHSGMKISNGDDIFSLYGTLEAEENMGLKLPEWTKEFFPDKLTELSKLSLSLNVYNETLRQMKSGPLVSKIARAMKEKTEGKLMPKERKMFMYVGHDSTIVAILAGLNLWQREIPGYSNMVMIELHEDSNGWNVQVFLKDSTTKPPRPLTIPGCSRACPLEQFESLMKPMLMTTSEWSELCQLKDPNWVPGKIPLP